MEEKSIPEIVSINQLCSMMSISRSRYYQILAEGLILPPIFSNSKSFMATGLCSFILHVTVRTN